MCASDMNPTALNLFKAAYPTPNAGPVGQTYNNYDWSQSNSDITNQFGIRMDYNRGAKDQVFGRVSWSGENKYVGAPLGPIFDGGRTDDDGTFFNHAKNAVFSWNHVLSETLINQARFAYNWGYFAWLPLTKNFTTIKSQYLQFRADVFNLFNTPSWGNPSNQTTSSIDGLITGPAFFGNYTPDARFFQLAAKYYF